MKKKLATLLLLFCFAVFPCYAAETQTQQKTVTAKQIVLKEQSIDKINITWARGKVTVNQSPDENIYITQKAFVMPKETEVVGTSIKNDTLFIQDYNTLSSLSEDTKQFQKKLEQYRDTEYDLELALPEKQYQEFYFKTVNADCIVSNNHFDIVTTEMVNGSIELNAVTSKSIQSNTVNGNIALYSDTNAEKYFLNSINGDIDAVFTTFPTELSTHTVRGNITLTLPENDGFTLEKSKLKTHKDFSTSFHLKDSNNKKIYKNGKIALDIVCTDGSVTLKKL